MSNGIDDYIGMAVRARILGVEVERIVREGRGGEERIVARVDGASPMMLEDLPLLEILEGVAFQHQLELTEIRLVGHASSS